MGNDDTIEELSAALVSELLIAGKSVATAESCTGGWIAKSITDIAGSSGCFAYGIVSYSNGAKESILAVKPATLQQHGAVSEQTVTEMATACMNLSGAELTVAVSGIAGPDGGTDDKPLGTVWFGWAVRRGGEVSTTAQVHKLKGDRRQVRLQSVIVALQGLRERLRTNE
jgi:nicotinamide-nucleotide amidase